MARIAGGDDAPECECGGFLKPDTVSFGSRPAVLRLSGSTTSICALRLRRSSMTRRCVAEVFREDLDAINGRCVFAGDSPNDQPMFGFFRHGVGVAILNVVVSATEGDGLRGHRNRGEQRRRAHHQVLTRRQGTGRG